VPLNQYKKIKRQRKGNMSLAASSSTRDVQLKMDLDNTTPKPSPLWKTGRDSFRSLTSDIDDSPCGPSASIAGRSRSSSRTYSVGSHGSQHSTRVRANINQNKLKTHHHNTITNYMQPDHLELPSFEQLPPSSRQSSKQSSASSGGRGGFSSNSSPTNGSGSGFRNCYNQVGACNSSHSKNTRTGFSDTGSYRSGSTTPQKQQPSSPRARNRRKKPQGGSYGKFDTGISLLSSPTHLESPVADRMSFRVMSTCKASDARRHKSRVSKWDTAEYFPPESDDDGDSFLDTFATRSRKSSRPHKTQGFTSGKDLFLSHSRSKTIGHNTTLRRIVSEQHSADSSPLGGVGLQQGRRRQTMNLSRRRPSQLGSLNLRSLAMAKPKYDSAHMWHLQNSNRASPQSLSCSMAHGLLYLDFDRTLAKDHTFKRSVRCGIKGLQKKSTEEIVDWFGGKDRLEMCKRYLNFLATMNIATIIVTHGTPPLVYSMMRKVGFFDDVKHGNSTEAAYCSDKSVHESTSDEVTGNSMRSIKLSLRGDNTSEKNVQLPAGPNTICGTMTDALALDKVANDSRSCSSGNNGNSSGSVPMPIVQQNKYGIVAIYGQSSDSAEKFLKSLCINEVTLKLVGKHPDEFEKIIFADDDRKNLMGVKRVCNFSTQQLVHVKPETAMTEKDFQTIINTFDHGFS